MVIKVSIEFIDRSGRNRSKLLSFVIFVSKYIPERISRTLWFRLLGGSNVMWMRGSAMPRDGILRLNSSFLILPGTRFDMEASASIDLAAGASTGFGAEFGFPKDGWIRVGRDSFVGSHTMVAGGGGITIGEKVLIGPYCSINSSNHGFEDNGTPYVDQRETFAAVSIENNVWIASHCTIAAGVTIGTGAVVAAGAVVVKDVAPYTLVGGVPATVIRVLRSAASAEVIVE